MNINKIREINNTIKVYNNNKVCKDKENILNSNNDKIEISSLGKKLSDMNIDNISINNDKKIEEIKKSIKDGTYKVDTSKLAEAMIKKIKEEKL
ncbi:flagellar biosynthesis anti-sigma factor FlgM [Clostridium fallax]|uniref:Negative regulator of flagellin synthesis n=1 Tax=Clostridium fallax TaxID=1533 RepID=A0A1M4UML8_9CLOT|nr:flagellar biosynthesis anti-sigma factor FlgM [Clostridium fallax]SHE57813.1 anti-sigma-28 factor, FlgM family [Clostridium fallax]SQB07641.1 negative regulator of flagellin synthesis [Clostridium fallax]